MGRALGRSTIQSIGGFTSCGTARGTRILFRVPTSLSALRSPPRHHFLSPMKSMTILSVWAMRPYLSAALITKAHRLRPGHFTAFHFYSSTRRTTYGFPHKSPPLYLNRILFDASEIDSANDEKDWMTTVTFPKSDYRTVHIAKILGLKNGEFVRAGSVINPTQHAPSDSNNAHHELEGLLTDEAVIEWLPEGKIKKAEPTKNGEPPGSLRLCIPHPPKTILQNQQANDNTSTAPPVSLLLALPRPLQLSRILPMISQLGIDTLVLTHAKKVPKDYFGSHLFRKPQVLRDLLIEGLTQSGTDLRLPKVVVSKRPLREFMEEELDALFPVEEIVRVIAHPERKSLNGGDGGDTSRRITDMEFDVKNGGRRRMLVAVG
jgi:hypothetical protein